MRHVNIKRITGIIFIDDSNFIDIKYEDNKGKNIDKFVLKNTVDGLSRSKSFIVGHSKYHIHNDRSEADKMSESLNRYNKTLENRIANMKDDFILKGEPVDVRKRYLGRSILSNPIPGGEAVINNAKKTYGYKVQLMTYDESTKNENIYNKDIIEHVMPRCGAISRLYPSEYTPSDVELINNLRNMSMLIQGSIEGKLVGVKYIQDGLHILSSYEYDSETQNWKLYEVSSILKEDGTYVDFDDDILISYIEDKHKSMNIPDFEEFVSNEVIASYIVYKPRVKLLGEHFATASNLLSTTLGPDAYMIKTRSEKDLMAERKAIKKNIDYTNLDVDIVFWKYLEFRGMKIRKGDDK